MVVDGKINAESPKIDEAPTERSGKNEAGYGQVNNNISLTPLTEKQKDQISEFLKQETLEEGIAYALRHMIKRCEGAGEEVTPIFWYSGF